MNDDVREWLIEELDSWIHTWDDDPNPAPKMLREIIKSLKKKFTKFTSEAYEEILFHLYQKLSDREEPEKFQEYFERWCERMKQEGVTDMPEDYEDWIQDAWEAGRSSRR